MQVIRAVIHLGLPILQLSPLTHPTPLPSPAPPPSATEAVLPLQPMAPREPFTGTPGAAVARQPLRLPGTH